MALVQKLFVGLLSLNGLMVGVIQGCLILMTGFLAQRQRA